MKTTCNLKNLVFFPQIKYAKLILWVGTSSALLQSGFTGARGELYKCTASPLCLLCYHYQLAAVRSPATSQARSKWAVGEQLYPGSCSQFAGSSVSTTVASYVPSHWSSTAVSRLSLVIFPFHGENLRLMVVAECGQSLCKLPFGAQLSFLSQLKRASALHNLGSPEERSRIMPNCRQCNGKVGKC